MEFKQIGNVQIALLCVGTLLFIVLPVIIAVIWKVKKKEKITTVLIGAAA